MIDAHAHLQDDAFDDVKEILVRARKSGVSGVVCASTNFDDSISCLDIARDFDMVWSAIGLAPYSDLSQLKAVMQLIEDSPDIVAVGEIGLDFPYERKVEQIEPFRSQIALAMELDLPVVIHSRSAGKYCIDLLEAIGAEKVLMHAFDGSIKHARRAFELGYRFSIPVTVLKNKEKQKLAREVPVDLLLLETDSPVLNPEGGRNEPANLSKSRDFIAELRGETPENIDRLSERNARKLFGL